MMGHVNKATQFYKYLDDARAKRLPFQFNALERQ